ncbi:hypothetical protein HNQ77_000890 [Silvibacterium bohemicum]|uniref:Uncharacterized protein n=1 Tax=Silvibacterium bohemicum TaxID=1577686 RepID=A0A841JNL0_9BACT|nr:hypothetical protein [Silvibacterium bohemicum]MBB6142946.1 hypothetical protein [Silvibacterium bohemicum]
MSQNMGFAGTVSNLDVALPEKTAAQQFYIDCCGLAAMQQRGVIV